MTYHMQDKDIEKIAEIGKKGLCTTQDLSYLLPDLRSLRGSEAPFTISS